MIPHTVILETLNAFFPDPAIPLVYQDPFTLLISVLLSAQCTDKKVNEVTPLLFAKAKTPLQMANLEEEAIAALIRPCGLHHNKSKAILALSKMLLSRFQGIVPSTLKELTSLPGVGHKTASVILIQAFNKEAFPVDTHIHRCAKRWGLSSGTTVEQTEKDLKRQFPSSLWAKLHLQIIYFARAFCQAKGHIRQNCPLCRLLPPDEQSADST